MQETSALPLSHSLALNIFFFFETGSAAVIQTDLELMADLLPQPRVLGDRCVPSHLGQP